MRLFLSAFLAGLLLLVIASELLLRKEILPQDDFTAHKRLFRQADQKDVAFGDSHVARGLVPVEGAVNLAYPSEGIAHFDLKAHAYFSTRDPGTVILPADPHLFSAYRLANRPDPDYLARLTGSSPPSWTELLILDPAYRSTLTRLWLSFLASGGNLTSRIEILPNGAMLSPGDLSKEDPASRTYAARDRVRWHRSGDPQHVEAEKRQFSRLLDFLAGKGANICLVTFPLSPDYRQAIEQTFSAQEKSGWQSNLAFFKEEAERVGGRYLDLHAAVSDLAEFRDVDHLNAQGALKYSPEIYRQCGGSRAPAQEGGA